NVLVIVVRYFGGTKLGVGGLIHAYKTATAEALTTAETVEKHETDRIRISFEYPQMNEVMSLIKEFELQIISQHFEMACEITLEVRRKLTDILLERLGKIENTQAALEA